MFWHCVGGAVIAGLLVVAAPNIAHQVTSDDGGWYSGATPDCPSWPAEAECENSLSPTCEYYDFYDYEQKEDEQG